MLKVSGGELDEGYVTAWADRLELRSIWDLIKQRLEQPP